MLRRLEVKNDWRSLTGDFWPPSVPAGRKTVIYGHNGSGKSTLSELLLLISEHSAPDGTVWEDHRGEATAADQTTSGTFPHLTVFTDRWVKENLSAFLDGDDATAIVTLGREAIDAQAKEERLAAEAAELQTQADALKSKIQDSEKRLEKLIETVQNEIVLHLKNSDFQRFTKNRYRAPKVRELLLEHSAGIPDELSYSTALARLHETAPDLIEVLASPPPFTPALLSEVSDVLQEVPIRVAIEALENNPETQQWVETGIGLHQETDTCHFCEGPLSNERRDQLARHFDESWSQIRKASSALLSLVRQHEDALQTWLTQLPEVVSFSRDFEPSYDSARRDLVDEIKRRLSSLKGLCATLESKASDPNQTLSLPQGCDLISSIDIAPLNEVVELHNQDARRHEELIKARQDTILNRILGSRADEFKKIQVSIKSCQAEMEGLQSKITTVTSDLEQVRQSQFTTTEMAEKLTSDLSHVYGKNHLQVVVTGSGKSYACRRGNQPATHLSLGEKTTLALLYFLRKLEDESASLPDKANRIVVIDDPSSSLDREALFATHHWLLDSLRDFGQFIVLTHDFSLLRLFLKSHKNLWGKTLKKIHSGDEEAIKFPNVTFLEIFASTDGNRRRSQIGLLPDVLLRNSSEYAYLFERVMTGISNVDDHEQLFLLPNAARRILEVFATFKVPHISDFLPALETLVKEMEGEPFRDVYDFCNRYSHGEGGEIIDVLDARTVSRQLVRCMQFLRAADRVHFERMRKATHTEHVGID